MSNFDIPLNNLFIKFDNEGEPRKKDCERITEGVKGLIV